MLNMYSDHYRLTANHVDGARTRRFRMRARGKLRKTIKTCETSSVVQDEQILLGLLEKSYADAERVAQTTALQRHLKLAEQAKQRLNDHAKAMHSANWPKDPAPCARLLKTHHPIAEAKP
jgi:hypothetical protein